MAFAGVLIGLEFDNCVKAKVITTNKNTHQLHQDLKMLYASSRKSKLSVEKVLSQLSVIIVSHVAFTGHSQELENYLRKRSRKLVFIGHPFFYATEKNSFVTVYEKGDVKSRIESPEIRGHEILRYIKDFLLTFYFVFKLKQRFDIYVGVNPLNALAGILLKKLGIVRIVIFFVIDYVPARFKNSIWNSIYHFTDRICVYTVDYTWNLSSAMTDARARRGVNNEKTNQMTVPTGTNFDRIEHLPIKEIDRTSIAFLSHLRKGQGVELILEAMPALVEKIPSVKLMVLGTGPLEKYFKKEVRERNLNNNVFFFGYIENHEHIERIISKCAVGIAPYVPEPSSFTFYTDPGKPKVYLGCGVPVIITKVPQVAFEIEKWGAGTAIDYNKHELIDAIVNLLTNDEIHRRCRQKALEFASKYTWDNIFRKAFNRMLTTTNMMHDLRS